MEGDVQCGSKGRTLSFMHREYHVIHKQDRRGVCKEQQQQQQWLVTRERRVGVGNLPISDIPDATRFDVDG